MKNGMIECSVCHSRIVNPSRKAVSRAYDRHRSKFSSKQRALNFLLVGGDCVLIGLQVFIIFFFLLTCKCAINCKQLCLLYLMRPVITYLVL